MYNFLLPRHSGLFLFQLLSLANRQIGIIITTDKRDNTITVVAQPPNRCRTNGRTIPVTIPEKITNILPILFSEIRSFWSVVIVVTIPKIGTSQKGIGCIP